MINYTDRLQRSAAGWHEPSSSSPATQEGDIEKIKQKAIFDTLYVPCENCGGGHIRPCQHCGDFGFHKVLFTQKEWEGMCRQSQPKKVEGEDVRKEAIAFAEFIYNNTESTEAINQYRYAGEVLNREQLYSIFSKFPKSLSTLPSTAENKIDIEHDRQVAQLAMLEMHHIMTGFAANDNKVTELMDTYLNEHYPPSETKPSGIEKEEETEWRPDKKINDYEWYCKNCGHNGMQVYCPSCNSNHWTKIKPQEKNTSVTEGKEDWGDWIKVTPETMPDKPALLLTSSQVIIIGDWYENGWRTHRSEWVPRNDGTEFKKLQSAYKFEDIIAWVPLPLTPYEKTL